MGSGQPSVINKQAMKVVERFVRKNPTATTSPRGGHHFCEAYQQSHKGKTEDTAKDSSPEASPDTQNEKELAGFCQTVPSFYCR
jgi:hypothetical protein